MYRNVIIKTHVQSVRREINLHYHTSFLCIIFQTYMIIMFFCIASTCRHGDVRLYGGYSKSDGLAEICINGQWTTICYQGWNEVNSIKFCRQLLGRENVGMSYN